ncbi:MAG: DUF2259 domain-containing protein [Treponema sp.]|jgi:predicted secreted protein|nr:DUF2259 domain-containing protein [Treponema sp.]
MRLKIAFYVVIIALMLATTGVWAGDIASYVDLGFSPDGRIYMFAQYGVESKTLRPWADLFIVDVPRNNFVPGGRISYTHDYPVLAGQDGAGALFRLISRNTALAEQYGVTYLFQGQALYIALDEHQATPRGETIEFRDFETGASYKATLCPTVEGSGAQLKSSFYINLERTGLNGSKKTYTVGTPQLKRPLINSYHIKKVMIAPHDGSVIIVIEMRKQSDNGADIRYMVEALRL